MNAFPSTTPFDRYRISKAIVCYYCKQEFDAFVVLVPEKQFITAEHKCPDGRVEPEKVIPLSDEHAMIFYAKTDGVLASIEETKKRYSK